MIETAGQGGFPFSNVGSPARLRESCSLQIARRGCVVSCGLEKGTVLTPRLAAATDSARGRVFPREG